LGHGQSAPGLKLTGMEVNPTHDTSQSLQYPLFHGQVFGRRFGADDTGHKLIPIKIIRTEIILTKME
jgi:hypothetical protein